MNKTLKTYIDNLFLGKEDKNNIKEDLLSSTNDKYNDLISNGYSENEAIGKIISEFGSIEEILTNDNNEVKINVKEKESKQFTIPEKIISIMFLVITLAYLLFGFIFNTWGILWIMYPIAGLIAGIINIITNYTKK